MQSLKVDTASLHSIFVSQLCVVRAPEFWPKQTTAVVHLK